MILNGCWAIPLIRSTTTARGVDFKKIESVPPSNALIYFYRESSMAGAISSWKISVNGQKIISLSNDEYYPYLCIPGITKVKGQIGIYSPEIEFNMEGGLTYYVRVVASADLSGTSSVKGNFVISLVDNNIGEKEILDNKLE